jgi:hypothetical protein
MIMFRPDEPFTTEELERRLSLEFCPACNSPVREPKFYQVILVCSHCQNDGLIDISFPPMSGPDGGGLGTQIVIRWRKQEPDFESGADALAIKDGDGSGSVRS